MDLKAVEHDRVVLLRDQPASGLRAGDVGTIVAVYAGAAAFEVEFCTLSGQTVAVVTLPRADIRAIEAREVAQARRLAG